MLININEADELTLATLPGVSTKLAARIVAYRAEHGPFADVLDLTAVPEISPIMVEQLADRVTVTLIAQPPIDPETPTEIPTEPITETAVVIPTVDEVIIRTPMNETNSSQPVPTQKSSSMVGYLMTAVFGAIVGTALTLSILFGFNQTLQYGSYAEQVQLQNELQTLQEEQEQMQSDLETLDAEVDTLTAGQENVVEAAATAQVELDSLQETAVTLQTRADDLQNRIAAVAESARNFDTFLVGLRDLLGEVVAPLPTPTPTHTPERSTAVPATATLVPTSTPDPAATRTPRPSATPINLPGNTPTVMPQP